MKTIKLIATLATASMFIACVEDLTPAENIQQGMNDVVSGEIIGTDITMNIPVPGVQTKLAGGNLKDWDSEDKIGLGWLNMGNEELANDNKVYANHLFYVNNDGKFEARGNIYKGWHFAYYPYTYMESISEITLDNLNPAQTGDLNVNTTAEYAKRLSQAFSVSALQLLTKESLVEPYYNELKPEVDLQPHRAVSRLNITTNPVAGSGFATNEDLKAYKINSITVDLGLPRFITNVTLKPTLLHKYDQTKTKEENDSLLIESFKKALSTTIQEESATLTTDVSAVDYTAGSTARVVAFTLPHTREVSQHPVKEKVQIIVSTNKGDFTIKYVEETSDTPEWQKTNNFAIDSLVRAYQPAGCMRLPGDHSVNLDLKLHEEIFGNDDWSVTSNEDWINKVDIAKSLNMETVTFELPETATVSFDGPVYGANAEGQDNLNIIVDASEKTFVNITGETTWPENVTFANKAAIKVTSTGALTVNNNLNVFSVENSGVIYINNGSYFGGTNGIGNNGTIEVSCGAKLASTVGNGHILYRVLGNETSEAIEKLSEDAYIDSLVVNNDWTVGGVNNNTVAVEFNGAVVEFESDATFKSVNVASGVNTITGNITAPVTVAAGATLTIDGNVTGEVTVEDGGTLTINGNVTGDVTVEAPAAVGAAVDAENPVDFTINGNVSGKVTVGGKAILNGNNIGNLTIAAGAEVTVTSDDFMTIGAIENKGTLNVVGINVYANSITTEAGSKTNIPDDKAIYYKESYKNNGGTTTGSVAVINVYEENDNYYKGDGYELIEGVYYVNSNAGLESALSANKDIIVELSADVKFTTATNLGGESTTSIVINGNGHVITFVQSETTASDAIETVNTINPEAVLTINNATITEESTIGKFWYNDDLIFGCKVVLTDVKATRMIAVENNATFTNFTSDCTNVEGSYYSIWIRPMTDNQVVTFNTTDNKKNLINNPDGRGIKIEKEYVAEPKHVTLNVNNTTFITGVKAAILVNTPAGATINWGEGNDISKTFDPEYPVWVDEAASTDDFLLVNGQNCTPVTESSRQKALEEQE